MLYPVYKGTYERGDGMESDKASMSSTWCDHVILWAKDVSRAMPPGPPLCRASPSAAKAHSIQARKSQSGTEAWRSCGPHQTS